MHADDAILYEGGQGQPVEEGVDPLPGPQALLVAHALYALQPEPKKRVDVRRLRSMGTLFTMARRGHASCASELQGKLLLCNVILQQL